MKSLKHSPFISYFPEIFTPEVIKHIFDEGFEDHINDSYCYKESGQVEWQKRCFRKHNGYDRYSRVQSIYIFPNGIGVDTDYDCGGNNSNVFWSFDGRSFEEVYDKMVDYINDYK